MGMTYWREELYREFRMMPLSGDVLDLGGTEGSTYRGLFNGHNSITSANLEPDCDIRCDFEEPLPVKDNSYDTILLINVLEHVYHAKELISESMRALRPGGTVVVAVPFLIPIHPCPRDHWRFSGETLERLFGDVGYKNIILKPLGTGPFMAAATLIHGALHFNIIRSIAFGIARILDSLLKKFDRKGSYGSDRYPLGYVLTAKKP